MRPERVGCLLAAGNFYIMRRTSALKYKPHERYIADSPAEYRQKHIPTPKMKRRSRGYRHKLRQSVAAACEIDTP